MANNILLKRSGNTGSAPGAGDLAYGELAINYEDGDLYFKDSANNVTVLASTNSLTLSGNLTAGDVTASGNVTGNIITNYIAPDDSTFVAVTGQLEVQDDLKVGQDIDVVGNLGANNIRADSITSVTGNVNGNVLKTTRRSGSFGGAVDLSKPKSGTSIQSNVIIDIYQNRLRFYDSGGVQRGGFIDLTAASTNIGSNLLATGNGGGGGGNTFSNITAVGGNSIEAVGDDTLFVEVQGSNLFLQANSVSKTLTFSTIPFGNSIFITGGDMDLITESVTASENLGNITTASTNDYDLGNITISGVVTTENIADQSIFGNKLAPNIEIVTTGDITTTGNITAAFLSGDGSNLSNITISPVGYSIIPNADDTYTLGNSNNRWANLWLSGNTLVLGNIVIKEVGASEIGFFQNDGTSPATIDQQNIDTTTIANGDSNVKVVANDGNVTVAVDGLANVAVFSKVTGLELAGNLVVEDDFSGNGNANIAGAVTATGNLVGGNVTTSGVITATGNVTGGNLLSSGLVSCTEIVKTGSNGVGNIGQVDNAFNIVFAQSTSALYADLAEKYEVDGLYEPGTVMVIGGTKELTCCSSEYDSAVVGVISTAPAYLMNAGSTGLPLALTGRVPCKVIGPVSKGDLLTTSSLAGHAQKFDPTKFVPGSIIAKSLEDFDGASGIIEVIVGRY